MTSAADDPPVGAVRDLRVVFPHPDGPVPAVAGVDLRVFAGRTTALIGESGSGKSVTGRAVTGLLPAGTQVGGRIEVTGRVLLDTPAGEAHDRWDRAHWDGLRGGGIGIVFQDALSALNPVLTVGRQIGAVVRRHDPASDRRAVAERVAALLAEVGIPDPARRVRAYPHELSGGQRQRALIALVLAAHPRVLIADEPTTALDTTVQAQILDLLHELCVGRRMGLLLITHDIGVVRDEADDVVVLRAGRTVEAGPAVAVLDAPRHPYTRMLLAATPRREHRGHPLPVAGDPAGGP